MNNKQYILNLIYRISLFLLLFIPGLVIVWWFIPLQFASTEIEDTFNETLTIIFMGAVWGTLAGTLKRTDNRALVVAKILLTVFVSVLIGFLIFLATFDLLLYDQKARRTLFINRRNTNISIVTPNVACSDTDSACNIKVFKRRKITPFFIYETGIDTNAIDKEKWIRVEHAR